MCFLNCFNSYHVLAYGLKAEDLVWVDYAEQANVFNFCFGVTEMTKKPDDINYLLAFQKDPRY